MKYYTVSTIKFRPNMEPSDEFIIYSGCSLSAAKALYEKAICDFKKLSRHDMKRTEVLAKVYDIPKNTVDCSNNDLRSNDDLVNALCSTLGCDDFAPPYDIRAYIAEVEEMQNNFD